MERFTTLALECINTTRITSTAFSPTFKNRNASFHTCALYGLIPELAAETLFCRGGVGAYSSIAGDQVEACGQFQRTTDLAVVLHENNRSVLPGLLFEVIDIYYNLSCWIKI